MKSFLKKILFLNLILLTTHLAAATDASISDDHQDEESRKRKVLLDSQEGEVKKRENLLR